MLYETFRDKQDGLHQSGALSWLERNCPAAIILDVSMPDIGGLEVLEAIRARPDLTGVPVIMHTATADATIAEVARVKGAAATVAKGAPQCLANLLQLVRGYYRREGRKQLKRHTFARSGLWLPLPAIPGEGRPGCRIV